MLIITTTITTEFDAFRMIPDWRLGTIITLLIGRSSIKTIRDLQLKMCAAAIASPMITK
jgi:hypothetical protein